MKRNKRSDCCRRCLSCFACLGKNILPQLGECSLPEGGQRRCRAIGEITQQLMTSLSITLRKMVKVTGDFLGCPYEIPVRRIERASAGSPVHEFTAGPDEYGEMITSRLLSTEDILAIRSAI